MNKVYLNWYEKLGENYVRKVFENFDIIEKEFYEERNKEEILNSYLNYESIIRNNWEKINELKKENERLSLMKKDIKNYIIYKLRNEGKLVNFLKNKDRKVLGKIRDLVDIEREYEIVDRIKFDEEKKNRGKGVSVSFNN